MACTLKWVKLSDAASEPKRGSQNAAGFDLCSARDVVLPPNGILAVSTDIQIALPKGL